MFDWLRGRRRLSPEAKRKLLVMAARSEENIIEAHVANILDLLDALGDELDVDRAVELYAEMLPMDEHVQATVSNRVIARYEDPREQGRYADVFREPHRR
ncbi:MAG TPA: hypothetical protein VEW03_15985 [Longimicrobiaceae bacterium]|nr:hypothetical protein [Longimicrobiaceae bacterium]